MVFLMPQLHLQRLSYDLFVYDFPYDFSGIYSYDFKLRHMCLHCLLSPCDFFRRQTRTKPYRDLADPMKTTRLSCSHRVIFTTSLYKLYNARTMILRKSQRVGMLTVQLSCNYVHGFKQPSMFIFECTFELCFKVI